MAQPVVHLPDSYKDRMNERDEQLRMEALSAAVKAHNAGDQKTDVLAKAREFLAFLKRE